MSEIKEKSKELKETAADLERTAILLMLQQEMNKDLEKYADGQPSQRYFHLREVREMIKEKKHLS